MCHKKGGKVHLGRRFVYKWGSRQIKGSLSQFSTCVFKRKGKETNKGKNRTEIPQGSFASQNENSVQFWAFYPPVERSQGQCRHKNNNTIALFGQALHNNITLPRSYLKMTLVFKVKIVYHCQNPSKWRFLKNANHISLKSFWSSFEVRFLLFTEDEQNSLEANYFYFGLWRAPPSVIERSCGRLSSICTAGTAPTYLFGVTHQSPSALPRSQKG